MARGVPVGCWVLGTVGTAAAVALPWARYGGIDIELFRFPNWGWYLAPAIALTVLTGWFVLRGPGPGTWPLLAGAALTVATAITAAAVMWRYDDSAALFDRFVPMVIPGIGPGGPVAVLAATLNWWALLLRWRAGVRGAAAMPARTDSPA